MKYTVSIFLIIIFSACSGTKRVIQKPKEKTEIITKTIDSATIEKPIDKTADSITLNEDNNKIENILNKVKPKKNLNHTLWNNLLKKHVSKQGNVNYKAFKNSRKQLLNYIDSLSKNMPTASWSKQEKLAYWINAYNAMTIDLILRHYPVKSIKDISKPWDQRFWKLGDKWYNLNEIEHQILRKMNEPRIHFAIVCASYSCPKLQNEAFTSENIEKQLTKTTKEFLSDSERNSISKNEIEISKIFQWFAKDFKKSGSLIDFLNQYSSIQISNKAKKTFKDYNWSLNE